MEASQGDTSERAEIERETSEREAVTPATERDTTDEWRIQPSRTIATVAELEERIDVAVVTARAAEEAALEIGTASLEAAAQARRAATLAERASAAAERAASEARSIAGGATRAVAEGPTAAGPRGTAPTEASRRTPGDFSPRPNGTDPRRPDPFEERITAFRLRAEKVMIRLQRLELGPQAADRTTTGIAPLDSSAP